MPFFGRSPDGPQSSLFRNGNGSRYRWQVWPQDPQSSLFRNGNRESTGISSCPMALNLPYLGMETPYVFPGLPISIDAQSSLFRNGNLSCPESMTLDTTLNLPYLGMETSDRALPRLSLQSSIFLI